MAAESDRLGGVALDVHYEEPSPENEPLKNYPRFDTPHRRGADNAAADMEEMIGNLAAAIDHRHRAVSIVGLDVAIGFSAFRFLANR